MCQTKWIALQHLKIGGRGDIMNQSRFPDFSDKSEARDSEWVDFLVPVELLREGAQAAWGFRLRGGSDVDGGTPLEIIKVT